MGWSGGSFSRVHDWTTDAGAAINIEASRMDAEDDNFASGIDACIHKGGSNTPTADLPMGGQKHTGVANAAARTDYASAADVQDQDLIYAVDNGAADAYTITCAPAFTAYEEGMRVVFRASAGNTGASTLAVNGLAATAIQTNDGSALVAGMIVTGGYYECTYDANGSRFVLTSPHSLIGSVGLQDTINNDDWSGTDLAVANGGTGSSTAADARTALGLAIGSNVQAWDANLDQIAALAVTDGNIIVGNGSAWVAESGATARTSLGLTIGTNVQAYDATLTALASVNATGANQFLVSDGIDSWALASATNVKAVLDLQIGTDVQAWDAGLDDIAALTETTDSTFIVGSATGWVAESGATARTSLGLGSIATQASNSVSITGGSITGITDLAIADGGTGASTAAGAATALGLGTGDSPQFTAVNLGHASDTTLSRSAAGKMLIEGKAALQHDGAYTSGDVTFGTSAAAGGASGDIHFQYTA